jgi:hypothetical protein
MIEKINIENYEAFYLDYLENNLSEEDRVLFELFLEKHPHLIEENFEIQPIQELYTGSLSNFEKQTFKVFDDEETINQLNIEDFIIAYCEGILNPSKTNELLSLINKSHEYKSLLNTYKATILSPDLSIKLETKSSLKKGKTRTLYYSLTSVAAILALAIYFFNSNQEIQVVRTNKHNIATNSKTNKSISIPVAKTSFPTVKTRKTIKNSIVTKTTEIELIETNEIEPIIVEHKNEPILAQNIPSQQFETTEINNKTPNEKSDNSYLSFSDMNKPLEFITQFLPKRISDFIDIRYAEKNNKKQSGYYIKIGDFQLSTKKSPDQNLSSR